MQVQDLQPGDVIEIVGEKAVYITRSSHPVYRGLDLVIWKLEDGTYSFDALHCKQEIGEKVDGGINHFKKAIGLRNG